MIVRILSIYWIRSNSSGEVSFGFLLTMLDDLKYLVAPFLCSCISDASGPKAHLKRWISPSLNLVLSTHSIYTSLAAFWLATTVSWSTSPDKSLVFPHNVEGINKLLALLESCPFRCFTSFKKDPPLHRVVTIGDVANSKRPLLIIPKVQLRFRVTCRSATVLAHYPQKLAKIVCG